jgi:hypothetical protein
MTVVLDFGMGSGGVCALTSPATAHNQHDSRSLKKLID